MDIIDKQARQSADVCDIVAISLVAKSLVTKSQVTNP
jgi:hypothetical protein